MFRIYMFKYMYIDTYTQNMTKGICIYIYINIFIHSCMAKVSALRYAICFADIASSASHMIRKKSSWRMHVYIFIYIHITNLRGNWYVNIIHGFSNNANIIMHNSIEQKPKYFLQMKMNFIFGWTAQRTNHQIGLI